MDVPLLRVPPATFLFLLARGSLSGPINGVDSGIAYGITDSGTVISEEKRFVRKRGTMETSKKGRCES